MNILIIRVSAIGDVIHTLPAVFLLKKTHPSARISWVVQEKAATLLKNQPFIDKLWILPDKFLHPKNWKKTYQVIKDLRRISWDAILDFQGIFKTSLLLACLKGKKHGFAFGHARSSIGPLFTHKTVTPDYFNIIQKNLALTSYVAQNLFKNKASPTIESIQKANYFEIQSKNQDPVNAWLKSNKINNYVIVAPNTTWESKLLPEDHWKNFLLKITTEYLKRENNQSLILVGAHFGKQAQNLATFIENEKLNVFIAPPWDLLTTSYLIKKAHLIIAPDTGLLHLADFLGTKSIGIFGPTSAIKCGPFLVEQNKKNAIQIDCPHRQKKTHGPLPEQNCMYKLTPEQLYAKMIENL